MRSDSLFSTAHTGTRRSEFVEVAVERAIASGALDSGLTYASDGGLRAGQRVLVPLGAGGKPAPGVVLRTGGEELLHGLDPDRVKNVIRGEPASIPEPLVELARWMAKYYVCPVGMVLSAFFPGAVKRGVGRRTERVLVREPLAAGADSLPTSAVSAWERIADLPESTFPIDERSLSSLIEARTVREVRSLVRAGLLGERDRLAVRAFVDSGAEPPGRSYSDTPEPTAEQHAAIDGIGATLGSFSVHLLKGVTGSGKTEVYIRLMRRVLDRGGNIVMAVPEIALTPQALWRLRGRLNDVGIAVLHSGLSASERHHHWHAARTGEARVVIGARSAVFAPFERLGLIVIDEEHDPDYKQDQSPRYHGRDVAIKRAQLEGCPVVLGSATPSLESWANATGNNPRYALRRLEERPMQQQLPEVRIVDLKHEQPGAGEASHQLRLIGPTLERELTRTVTGGGQSLILINRRGFANYLMCPSPKCGWVLHCDECDAAMVLHKDRRLRLGSAVRCHHCGAEQLPPGLCPVCRQRVIAFGMGTQRVEQELADRLGPERLGPEHGLVLDQTLVRVDSDSLRGGRGWAQLLGRFERGEIRVIVGTQMIAKGLDFPNVRLVGVINADTALAVPDFRCTERTFQLVSQVAGRAGRSQEPGLVIVQTLDAGAPAVRYAATHDYDAFAAEELAARGRAGLPPFSRMARIVCRDASLERVRSRVDAVGDALRRVGGVHVDGPMPCAIARISSQHRWSVEARAPTAVVLQAALQALAGAGMLKSDAATAVDVDPVSLT